MKKLSTMALKGNKSVMVYDTKQGKHYPIHPALSKDATWMNQRHLIIQDQPKPMEVSNLQEALNETQTPVVNKTKTKA